MKKSIILVLGVVVVLAFASAAYASTFSTYAAWSSAAPNDAPPTPHKGYATNTNKCAVCHAVHKASDTGQVLLRSTVADSCIYCHVNTVTGAGILTFWIYNGTAAAYTADTAYPSFGGGVAHNNGCSDCHSVHGARTIGGSRTAKILKDWGYSQFDRVYSTFALAKWGSAANISAELSQNTQVTAWCTGCHPYFVEAYESTITYYANSVGGTARISGSTYNSMKSHIMTGLAGGYTNPAATLAAGTDVAWAPSIYCRSCHDAGTTDDGPGTIQRSFPHYTPNYYRFMSIGATTGASPAQNNIGTVDGLCLKCHVNGAGDTGIGITF